ncbi:MAG: sulfotransferase [Bacteroidota bacterium]
MNKPNFLVIGAARSGTTLLHSYLLQHPEIYVPKNKQPEPHFFLKSHLYQKGEDWYHEKFFSEVTSEKAIGEISTSYLFGEKVPERIKNYNPHMRFLVMLREPKQRAFSNYWHSFKNGFEHIPFEDAIKQEELRSENLSEELKEIAPYSYVGRSAYFGQLNRFLNHFHRAQFMPMLFEDFISKPLEVLQEICWFLKVDESFAFSPITEKENASNPGQEIDGSTKTYLDEVFEPLNRELAELFDLNLEKWK